MLLLLKLLGWLIAHAPEALLRPVAAMLGDAIFFGLRSRRRLILSNLHHAFPEKPAAWRHRTGRQSCRRMIETGLLSLATPCLHRERLRQIVSATPEMRAVYAAHHADPAPTLICSPHIAYWEAQTAMSLLVPTPFPEFGTIYRPLDHRAADAFVKASRERFGMQLLSRREGFGEALKILRRRGFVGLLFDQNAGLQGALTTLFGRVCSTTELPGIMAEKFGARVFGIYARRHAFWRVEITLEPIASDGTSTGVTLALNRWLENLLHRDDDVCASWLWAHARWRNQDMPARRFRLEAKRNLLADEAALAAGTRASDSSGAARIDASHPALPHRTRIWIRLPNWLGDVVMTLPLLRAIRAGRPDAEIVLVAKKPFVPLLESWQLADRVDALPPRGLGYFARFWQLRREFPDVWLLLTNSARGDLEAWLAGAPQRFGIVRPGKPRPLLSHAYRLPAGFDEQTHHQLELWENFLRHFGLVAPLDRAPLSSTHHSPLPPHEIRPPIGLICGSENLPAKRWPVAHWRALIEAVPGERFVLFGTAGDRPVTAAVAAGFAPERVHDLAGKTDLLALAENLRGCRLLVTNDTGGMHLANALGVPLLALFGPTNPTRTGPIFSAPTQILQSASGSLADLAPERVATGVQVLLRSGVPALDARL